MPSKGVCLAIPFGRDKCCINQRAIAQEEKRRMPVSVELLHGDIRTIDLNRRFDIAIAMFAVIGYQTTGKKSQEPKQREAVEETRA